MRPTKTGAYVEKFSQSFSILDAFENGQKEIAPGLSLNAYGVFVKRSRIFVKIAKSAEGPQV